MLPLFVFLRDNVHLMKWRSLEKAVESSWKMYVLIIRSHPNLFLCMKLCFNLSVSMEKGVLLELPFIKCTLSRKNKNPKAV